MTDNYHNSHSFLKDAGGYQSVDHCLVENPRFTILSRFKYRFFLNEKSKFQ